MAFNLMNNFVINHKYEWILFIYPQFAVFVNLLLVVLKINLNILPNKVIIRNELFNWVIRKKTEEKDLKIETFLLISWNPSCEH